MRIKIFLCTVFVALLIGTMSTARTTQELHTVCTWERNGCFVVVDQWYGHWKMTILCEGEKQKDFTGQGEWGGYCQGESNLDLRRTDLPDTTR